jgi:hypothetical protein
MAESVAESDASHSVGAAVNTTSYIERNFGSYSYDQSNKIVSVHVPFQGAREDTVELKCSDRAFELAVVAGHERWARKVPHLCHAIDPARSRTVIKEERVVVKLAKREPGVEWSALDDALDVKERTRKARVERGELKGASTQALLADMYADATDEDRKGLMEAAHQGRSKREGAGPA